MLLGARQQIQGKQRPSQGIVSISKLGDDPNTNRTKPANVIETKSLLAKKQTKALLKKGSPT